MLKNLAAARLVTLTGPGGVGKTRLAGEVSAHLHGPVWFVELASVTDPAEVPYAVLDAVGVREPVIRRRGAQPGASPLDRLAAALADRDEVLVLDNCEHVIEAAAALAGRVLAACPRMRIVATSRQPLRIEGETLSPVPPLAVPPADVPAGESCGSLESYGSVRLLRDRAVAVRPDFELGAANAAAVTRICRALDGMPLAIELAAVWLRTLTPAQLAERLDDRFALLTGGSRTALPRHRTLRAVVDWSWDLLAPAEQVLARRLAVFPAGATLAMAEQVCADDLLPSAAVLPALSGLVDQSIVAVGQTPDGGDGDLAMSPRYRMLETVRAYGLERLAEAGEQDQIRDAFAARYLDLAETADPRLRTADQGRWLRELAAEQDNLHAALRLAITRRDADTALRFVRALGWYWQLRGQPGEPETLARDVLELQPRERSPRIAEARIVCALTAAGIAYEIDAVQPVLASAVADYAELTGGAPPSNPVAAMGEPMLALHDRDPERAFAVLDRYMTSPDPWIQAAVPLLRGSFGRLLGHIDWAESGCRESLAAFRALGESWGAASVLIQLGELAQLRGDHATAIAAVEEAGSLRQETGRVGGPDLYRRDAGRDQAQDGRPGARPRGPRAGRARRIRAERELRRHAGRGWRWCAPSCTAVRATWPRRPATASGCWPGWTSSRRRGGTACARTCAPGRPWWSSPKGTRPAAARCSPPRWVPPRNGWTPGARRRHGRHRRLRAPGVRPRRAGARRIAVFVLHGSSDTDRGRATLAATLLGAGHTIRGAFDEGSLDAPGARDAARGLLGEAGFDAAYERGRALGRDETLAMASGAVGLPGQVLRR